MKQLNNFKVILLLFVIVFADKQGNAQQDPHFTQYMYNTIYVNPAYAGSRDAMTIGVLHRTQWAGFEGAPSTQNFFLHSPMLNDRIGFGFSMIHDRIGPINQTFFYGDFAYRIKLNENLRLAMGIKAGVNVFQPRLSSVDLIEPNDPLYVDAEIKHTTAPNFGFGVYLHHDKWYVGLSTPRLIESSLKTANDNLNVVLEKRHFFLIGGLILPAGSNVKIKPTIQSKITSNAPVSIDASLEALFLDRFSVGVAYRLDDAVSGLAGVYITPQLRLGLAYDYSTSDIQNHSSGSYEVMLQYDIVFRNNKKIISPRYF